MQPYEIYQIATILTAVCAVGFTAWQAWEERRHNKISVRPRLCMFSRATFNPKNKECDIFYKIENKGLGPAFITESQIVVDGRTCSAKEAIELVLQGENYRLVERSELGNRTAIRKDGTLDWFQVRVRVNTEDEAEEISDLLKKRAYIKIQYESVYGEKKTLMEPELE